MGATISRKIAKSFKMSAMSLQILAIREREKCQLKLMKQKEIFFKNAKQISRTLTKTKEYIYRYRFALQSRFVLKKIKEKQVCNNSK